LDARFDVGPEQRRDAIGGLSTKPVTQQGVIGGYFFVQAVGHPTSRSGSTPAQRCIERKDTDASWARLYLSEDDATYRRKKPQLVRAVFLSSALAQSQVAVFLSVIKIR
jgi:hypothetical protein